MEYILTSLLRVPDAVWGILAFFLPSTKIFSFIFEKLGYVRKPA